jgi:Mrp family chromosome partitioning ATPase
MQFLKKEALQPLAKVKKIIAVMSGKGGVGKSVTTMMLATHLHHQSFSVGILDADILGPSIPNAFGIKGKVVGKEGLIYPSLSHDGIQIMSSNLLLEKPDDPILWRGPLVTDMVRQFFVDVYWKELDMLFIDMPPGTGDVALTIFQQLPISGIIMVTSPQDSVNMVVSKGVKMAQMLKIPVLGIIENFSYFECTSCHEKHALFGPSKTAKIANQFNLEILGEIPIDSAIANAVDEGLVEMIRVPYYDKAIAKIMALLN